MKYTLLLTYLLAFFSCAPAKRLEIISRTMARNTQFGVWKCSHSKTSVILSFEVLGLFCPKSPKRLPQVEKSQPSKKSRITSKPLKIDKKCQLNLNKKSEKSRWRHIRLAIKPRYFGNHASHIKSYYGTLLGSHSRSFRIRHEKVRTCSDPCRKTDDDVISAVAF